MCRCNERLNAKTDGSTRLVYTGLCEGLEHLKIETDEVIRGQEQRGLRVWSVNMRSRIYRCAIYVEVNTQFWHRDEEVSKKSIMHCINGPGDWCIWVYLTTEYHLHSLLFQTPSTRDTTFPWSTQCVRSQRSRGTTSSSTSPQVSPWAPSPWDLKLLVYEV